MQIHTDSKGKVVAWTNIGNGFGNSPKTRGLADREPLTLDLLNQNQ